GIKNDMKKPKNITEKGTMRTKNSEKILLEWSEEVLKKGKKNGKKRVCVLNVGGRWRIKNGGLVKDVGNKKGEKIMKTRIKDKRHKFLRKPCKKCKKMFQRVSKFNQVCEDCLNKHGRWGKR
ncbi:hypothetical protein LCGC14_2549090, partial [marine sediment metagenome]